MPNPSHHSPLAPLALLALALSPLACASVDSREGVPYDPRYGEATKMDVYLPSGGGSARPGVLFVHGGSWQFGSRSSFSTDASRLARSGYVTASIDYRLSGDAQFPAQIRDVECALSFFQSHAADYGLDPRRVVLIGYSAGAHLSSLLAVGLDDPALATDCPTGVPSPPAGVVSGDGPQDMRSLPESSAVTDFLGGTAAELPAVYDEASPIFHVKPGAPPFLLIHGSVDWVVDLESASRMRDALAAAGTDVDFLKTAGGGHVLTPTPSGDALDLSSTLDTTEAWIAIEDFLTRTIGAP